MLYFANCPVHYSNFVVMTPLRLKRIKFYDVKMENSGFVVNLVNGCCDYID